MKANVLLYNTLWILLQVSCNQPLTEKEDLPLIELEELEVIPDPIVL